MKYCQQCGKELILKEIGDEGKIPFCMDCNKPYFNNPVCSVLVAVINKNYEVLLLRQNYVSKTNWVLIAGYINEGETLEETVHREVLEETGLKVNKMKYINSYFYKKKKLLMIGYIAFSDTISLQLTSKEVDDLKWVKLSNALSLLREGSIGQKHLYKVIDYLEKDKN